MKVNKATAIVRNGLDLSQRDECVLNLHFDCQMGGCGKRP